MKTPRTGSEWVAMWTHRVSFCQCLVHGSIIDNGMQAPLGLQIDQLQQQLIHLDLSLCYNYAFCAQTASRKKGLSYVLWQLIRIQQKTVALMSRDDNSWSKNGSNRTLPTAIAVREALWTVCSSTCSTMSCDRTALVMTRCMLLSGHLSSTFSVGYAWESATETAAAICSTATDFISSFALWLLLWRLWLRLWLLWLWRRGKSYDGSILFTGGRDPKTPRLRRNTCGRAVTNTCHDPVMIEQCRDVDTRITLFTTSHSPADDAHNVRRTIPVIDETTSRIALTGIRSSSRWLPCANHILHQTTAVILEALIIRDEGDTLRCKERVWRITHFFRCAAKSHDFYRRLLLTSRSVKSCIWRLRDQGRWQDTDIQASFHLDDGDVVVIRLRIVTCMDLCGFNSTEMERGALTLERSVCVDVDSCNLHLSVGDAVTSWGAIVKRMAYH